MAIEVVRADITTLDVDAIVNAANSALAGGGGVDGAIHRAAGPELLAACRMHGRCPPGQAVVTPGFRLRARFVIHAVGPADGDAEVLNVRTRVRFESPRISGQPPFQRYRLAPMASPSDQPPR